jgi:hypothetical protein
MPRGVSTKREREYEKLKREFHREGRYKGREEEVAARIVNQQRNQMGETQEDRRKDRQGQSPDRHLPIDDYEQLTVPEVIQKAERLDKDELRKVRAFERSHRRRKTLLSRLDRMLTG